MAAMVIIPSAANATFGISGYTYTNSSLQASGHPDTTISFNRTGTENEDLKDIQLDLPAGVFANPEAANPKCTPTQFNSDSCPAAAQVGTVSVKVKALSLLDLTIPGTVDVLTADNGQVATLGLTLRPDAICIVIFCAQPNKIFLKTGITINTFDDSNLRTYTPGSPKSAVIGIPLLFVTPTITGDITINSLSLAFQARSGTPVTTCIFGFCSTKAPAGPYFFRQAGACTPATSNVKLVSYQGATASASNTYTPTGCSSVPYTSTAFSFTPAITKYKTPSPVVFNLSIPEADATIQHALPKIVDNDFPNGSGINLDALNGVTSCTETQLRAKACPASSKIGTASAASKYLPAGLKGDVYATGSVGNQVPIAVLLRGQAQGANDQTYVIFRGTLGVRGTVEGGDGHAYARFDKIPQLPFSAFTLNMSVPVYVNPDKCGTATTTANITQFSGQTIQKTNSYTNTDCPAAPNTTITQQPASTTVDPTADFKYSSTIAGSSFTCAIGKRTSASTPATLGAPFNCNGDQWTSTGTTGSWTSDELTNGTYDFAVYATNQTVADPTPATATFTLNVSSVFTMTPSITPSTVQAASHPDFTAAVDFTGGQPKTVKIKMPKGFNASLATAEQCPVADALAGACTSASEIGTASLVANVGSGTENSTSGTIYLTDGGADPDDAAGIAVKIQSPSGTFIAQAGAYLTNNGNNQSLDIRSFPNKLAPGNVDFTIKNLSLNFTGSSGLLTTPSQCGTDTFTSSGTSYDGQIAAVASVNLNTTGCSNILGNFTPDLLQTFSSTTAGTSSNVDAFISGLGDNTGTIKNMTVLEPAAFGANYAAFGVANDMCPGGSVTGTNSEFDPSSCPGSAVIGQMYIYTPLLIDPIVGTVYLINQLPLPWFGVAFDQPGIHVRLTGFTDLVKVNPACNETNPDGSTGFCQKQISVKFNNVPDIPVNAVDFMLMNEPRLNYLGTKMLTSEVLKVSDPNTSNCPKSPNNTSQAKAIVESYTGAIKNLSQDIEFFGC